jgi:16S rRNA processing protein RimM
MSPSPTRPNKAAPVTSPQKETTIPQAATPAPPRADRLVTLAVVIGAHGVGGEVRLKLFTDDLAPYKELRAGERLFHVRSLRGGGAATIARLAEVIDRNGAEALRGTLLQVARSALPPLAEGEYYHSDLVGLPCIDTAGEALGHVAEVENFGAGDVIEIERPDGKRFMVPMRPEAVPEWDEHRLVVNAAFVG